MYQNSHESQNIKWSMIVLSLSLVLVYIILYYVKWDLWKNDNIVDNVNSVEFSNMNTGLIISNIVDTWNINETNTENNENVDKEVVVKIQNNESDNEIIEDKKNNNIEIEDWDTVILSWTKTYYGKLDFVSRLWISYKYALKDDKNIYYLNMWDYDYDFSDIARKLKWSLYVMNTYIHKYTWV